MKLRGRATGRSASLAAAAVCATFGLSSSPAVAAPVDVASAHAGLRAYQAYVRSIATGFSGAQRGNDAFIGSISAGCPNVLAAVSALPLNSVDRGATGALREEASADLGLASTSPALAALGPLTRKVVRLRWSSRARAASIRRSLAAERRFLRLAPSDLCADARALAASNAQATPPATVAFLARYSRLQSAAGLEALHSTLQRFLTPTDARVVASINRLVKLVGARYKALRAAEHPKLLSALGLSG